MLSHLHLAIIIAVVVLLLLVLYVYMNPWIITDIEEDLYHYPVYTLTATYASGTCFPIANDLAASRKFVTNQSGDGIFYETSPAANTKYTTAILVVKCSATDYLTAFTTASGSKTVPTSLTTSTTPYVGVVVQFTPKSATSTTMSKYLINKNITVSDATAANWLGVVDLTLLFANAASSTFNMSSIGTYTETLPMVNGVAATSAAFATATTVTSWPASVGGTSTVNLVTDTAGLGYGITLTCTTPSLSVSS